MPRLHSPEQNAAQCSFCGQNQNRIAKLIAGPNVYICNECIDLCQDIIMEEMPEPPPLAVAMEDYRRQLHELGAQVGELANKVKATARREARNPSPKDP